MSASTCKTHLHCPYWLRAAALALCAPLFPLAAQAQEHVAIHTLTFDMPNMKAQTFRVTSRTEMDLHASVASDPSDVDVCSVTPAHSRGTLNHVTGELYADFTVVPKAPGDCTIAITDPKWRTVHVKATVNLHGVYVIDGNAIKVFEAGTSGDAAPIATLSGAKTGLDNPHGIAIDRSGNIYVANAGNSSITVYRANRTGDRAPLAVIRGSKTGLASPYGIALDSAGYIYVTNSEGGITKQGSVTIFHPDPKGVLDEEPLASIKGTLTMLSSPRGIALDKSGRIYVVNHTGSSKEPAYTSGTVSVYAAKAGPAPMGVLNDEPVAVITGENTKLMAPTSIALDTSGRIYVANTAIGSERVGHIEVYAANPTGIVNEAPLATITGPNTSLGLPEGIAITENGEILVANPIATPANGIGPSVTSYTINGNADASPLMMLVGSNVESPSGVAVH